MMKVLLFGRFMMAFGFFFGCLGLVRPAPTLTVESVVSPPNPLGINQPHDQWPKVRVFANSDVKGVHDPGIVTLCFTPLTPGAPDSFSCSSVEVFPDPSYVFNGPSVYRTVPYYIPQDVPDGSAYQIELRFIAESEAPKDAEGNPIPMTLVAGTLLVSQRPLLKGDLNRDGRLNVEDAIISLRLAIGLDPSTAIESLPADIGAQAYRRAADDVHADGQLNVLDTIALLWLIIGPL